MTVFLWTVIIILVLLLCAVYFRTSRILDRADKMLDSAIDNTFSESEFTEKRLSKLESKMQRFLSSGSTSLKKINSEKDGIKTLISDISHQTKTPVTNILLYSQLLKESPDLGNNEKEIAAQIERQAGKLSFLISALIKTSRLENGIISVSPKENSVKKLLECVDIESAAAKNISCSVENAGDITAVFDFKWTTEAISNIFDNAVKYTPEKGSVTVSAKEYEMFVCVNIKDTGIGISEEETAKIFGRFYRSPEVSEREGVGIGLYLSREIITKEGGYIKVSSEKGKGSVFSVFLPKDTNLSKL